MSTQSNSSDKIKPELESKIINNELEIFSCMHQGLSERDVILLAKLLGCNTSLRKLEFVGCSMYDSDTKDPIFPEMIIESLFDNTSVSSLTLSRCILKRPISESICKLIMTNTILRELDLSYTQIGNRFPVSRRPIPEMSLNISEIAHAIIYNKTLLVLDLECIHMNQQEIREIATMLASNSTLREINLSANNLGSNGTKTIVNSLLSNCHLQKLLLERNNICIEGLDAIATLLQNNNTLTHLDLRVNGIDETGAHVIANSLLNNLTLQYLDLDVNEIGSDGAIAFATVLRSNQTLTSLHLNGNKIDDIAAIKLVESLELKAQFNELSLGMNYISLTGVLDIFKLLRKNIPLKSLTLFGNKFSLNNDTKIATDVINTLSKVFTTNTNLQYFDWNCYMNQYDIITLTKSLSINKTIHTFIFSSRELPLCVKKITELLESNYIIRNFGPHDEKLCAPINDILERNKNLLENQRFAKTKVANI